jgi:hypothetical protein
MIRHINDVLGTKYFIAATFQKLRHNDNSKTIFVTSYEYVSEDDFQNFKKNCGEKFKNENDELWKGQVYFTFRHLDKLLF